MNNLDFRTYSLSLSDKEHLKIYAVKLISEGANTKEQLYTRIRMVAKILSEINEAKVKVKEVKASNNLHMAKDLHAVGIK